MERLFVLAALILIAILCPPHARAEQALSDDGPAGIADPSSWSPLPLPPDAIVPSDPLGYLGGSSHVTPTGDFTWSLPLWTPPSRGGAQPDLSITYSARGGNNLLGVGFGLAGLPEIRRCGRTVATHGETRGVSYSLSDRFCLDGSPLVLISGNYGEDGSEYRVERGGFDKIKFHEGATFSPSAFEVWTKEGKIVRYESLKAFRGEPSPAWPYTIQPVDLVDVVWVLSDVKTRAGDRIIYKYAILPSPDPFAIEYALDRIEYPIRAGEGSAAREVRFIYEDRADPSFTWVSGVSFRATKRLLAVELYAPNPTAKGLVGRYEFAYQRSPITNRSLLRSISRCDGAGACLWSKELDWETSPRPEFFDPIELSQVEYPLDFFVKPNDDSGILVFDGDGDGKDELLYRVGSDFFIRRMDASGTPLGERILIDPVLSAPAPGFPGFHDIFLNQTRPVDMDGDGSSELWAAQAPWLQYHAFKLNSGSGQLESMDMAFGAQHIVNGGAIYFEALNFGDIDGDGLVDVLHQFFTGGTESFWDIYRNEGGFKLESPLLTPVHAYGGNAARLVDMNGDGRAEVWNASDFAGTESLVMGLDADGQVVVDTQTGLGFEAKRAIFIDLNGDGLRDLLRPGAPSGWVRWSTGAGYGPKEPLVNGPQPDGNVSLGMDEGTHVADLNSDGREDVLAFRLTPSPQVIGYLSRGDGSFDPIAIGTWPGQFHHYQGFSTSRTGDFNGDGLVDLVVVDLDHRLRVLVQKPGQVDVVKAIGDSVGAKPRELIHYSSQWSEAPQQATCVFPQRCIRHGLPVVREHWVWQGAEVGQYKKMLYDYQDPRVDLQGRGFLGFGAVRARDPDRLSETISTFDHGKRDGTIYPEAGLPKTVRHVAPILSDAAPSLPATVRARVTEVENEYALKPINSGKTHFVHLSKWSSSEWEQDVVLRSDGIDVPPDPGAAILRKRSGSFALDEYGNTTKVEEETQDGVRRVLEISYDIRLDDWLISLPKTTTYLGIDNGPNSIGGAGHVPEPRVVEHAHDALGLLKAVKVEPEALDPHVKLTTTFERNSDGSITKITSEAPGEAPRYVHVTYDTAEGIFPIKISNGLGYTDSFVFHPAYGVLAASRDRNGVETRAQHDAFGRLRRVERDGEAGVDLFSSAVLKNGWVAGLAEHVQSDAGDESVVVLDELGRPVEEAARAFDGQWSRSAITYDRLGRTKHISRPEFGIVSPNRTTFFYDTLDRKVGALAPDGWYTAFDHELLKVTTREAGEEKNILVFDVEGRVEQSIDVLDGAEVPTTYVYGAFDLIRNVIDPQGNITSLNYDKRGRRTALVDPDRGVTVTQFNGFDEVMSEENALGQVTEWKRDGVGRVYERHDADGATSFVWSSQEGRLGLLESTLSPDGTKTDHWYDDFGRPTVLTWTLDTGDAYSVTRHYDTLGRLQRVEYPEVPERSRFSIEYVYTPYNHLEKIRDPASQGLPFWTVQGRNADGALTQAATGDGSIQKRSFWPLTGRVDVLEVKNAGKVLESIKHTFLPNGNLKTRTDNVNGRTETFEHDDLDRLTSWKLDTAAGSRETSYHFDVLGNLRQVFVNGQLETENEYGENGKPHALTSTKSPALQGSYLYDALGRITQGGGRAIEHTAFDLPKSIEQDGAKTDFSYDAFGKRVRKSRPGASSVYIGELYEKREKNGEIDHVFYVPGEGGPVAEVHWNHVQHKETTRYLHGDALSSTRLVTDHQGNELERIYFEPFGQRIEYDGSPTAQGYTPVTEVGFAGHHHDDDLGLINMRGRIYDPALRRFITPDPLVAFPLFGQAFNRYAYGLNNPLRFIDPSGFAPQDGAPDLSVTGTPNLDAPRRASPPPRKAPAGNAQPSQGGAKGPTSETSDANGNEPPSGSRAPATPPPSMAPPPTAETASSPATAAPTTAAHPMTAAAPATPVGPPPPEYSGAGEPAGTLEPQSWRDNPVAQIVGGYLAGLALGVVPGGGIGAQALTGAGVLARGTRSAQIGRAVGETVGGVVLMLAGAGGSIGGGFISLSGVGAAVGVPAAAVSAGLVTAGAGNVAAGLHGLAQALTTGSGAGTQYPHDWASRSTKQHSAKYGSQREARALARTKLGRNPVEVEPGKLRSRDGRWQYRGKAADLEGHGPGDSPHIHLERLNPETGEVLENWHLRWE